MHKVDKDIFDFSINKIVTLDNEIIFDFSIWLLTQKILKFL